MADNSLYKGGFKQVELATDEVFTAPISVSGEENFPKEGQTLPGPESAEVLTEMDAADREGTTGYKIPIAIRIRKMDTADVTTLQTAAEALTPYYIRVTARDGVTKFIYKKVLLRVVHGPIVEFGKFGAVVISGEATGVTAADTYSVTQS